MCGTCHFPNLATLAAVCLLAGCTQQPQFRERDETASLTPQARRYVQEQLAIHFGSPTASVAWDALPVRFHSVRGTVSEVRGARELTLGFEGENDYQTLPVEAGDEVVWLSGKLVQQPSGVVQHYDPETRTVELAARLDLPPFTQPFDGPGAAITQGTLFFQVGDGPEAEVVIDESNATLGGLENAINSAGSGVTASIVPVEERTDKNADENADDGAEAGAKVRLQLSGPVNIFNGLAPSTEEAARPNFDLLMPGDAVAIGPGKVLQHGRLLYAEHCQHCHGVSGDGAGPTAQYLNPLPRDYRSGIFKFTSTSSTRRARRGDLESVIENGVPGTYMPSFKLLEADEMAAIIEYVLWLSMRGETELKLVGDPDFTPPVAGILSESYGPDAVAELQERANGQLADVEEQLKTYQTALATLQERRSAAAGEELTAINAAITEVGDAIEIIEDNIRIARDDVADPLRISRREFADNFEYLQTDMEERVYGIISSDWTLAENDDALVLPKTPRPPSDAASIARGRDVFMNPNAKCATCHGEAGLGNGDSTITVGVGNTEPGLFDSWGHEITPRDLTSGIYRGGRRPLDIYRRIHSGIKGTPMSGFGTSLTEEQIWDLVNYVLSMPFEERELGAGADVPGSSQSPPEVAATQPTLTPDP